MTPELKKSIKNIIDYLSYDEMIHWMENDKPNKHIHHDIDKVKKALEANAI
jgi:hypothetical protein